MLKRFWKWLGFHVHEWSEWELTAVIRHRHAADGQMHVVGDSQERRCSGCGLHQFHKTYRV